MKPTARLRSFILASSALVLAAPSAFAQTTYNGTSGAGGATDTWNIAGRWSSGVPTGAINAIIDPSKYVVVNATTGAYTGSLSIGTGSTLQIGWGSADATRYNALGNGNVTMAAGSSILTRNEGTMSFASLTLTGDASIRGGDSTQRGVQMNFGAISGAYTLSLYNHNSNFTAGNSNLNAANSFSALILTATDNTSSTVNAKVAGSLGNGDVTLNSGKLTFGTAAGALDIMANTGVLRINGGIAADRVTMTASDTIGGVILNGAKQLSGTYGSAETWLGGAGTLTVLGATSAYWDIDDSVAGAGGTAPAGFWGGTSNWNSAAAGNVTTTTWTAGQNAIFAAGTNATGPYAVTISGTQDVAGFGFEEGSVTLSGDALNLTETAPVVVKSGASANIQSVIESTSGFALHKSGVGALTLSGANTYTGGTLIAEGTLNINAAGVAGVSGPLGNGGTFTINGGAIDNTSGSAKVVLNVNPIAVNSDFAFSTAGGTANNNLTLPGAVNLGGGTRTITTNGAGVLTLSGNITNGTLAKSGAGTLTISGTNSHSGTIINAGKLIAVGASALGSGTITMQTASSTLHLQRDTGLTVANAWSFPSRNFTQTIIIDRETSDTSGNWTVSGGLNQLSGNTMIWQKGSNITNTPTINLSGGMPSSDSTAGTIKMVAESVNLRIGIISNTRQRTVELAGDTTGNEVYGVISNNGSYPGTILKSGAGTWKLSGANTYNSVTTITGGTLALGANNVLPTTKVTIGSATLDAATFDDTTGILDVTGAAIINLGAGANLAFADSELEDWTGGTLNITGTLDPTSLRFGTDNTGLSLAQLAVISVNGTGTGTYILDPSGYLIVGGGGPGPLDHFAISSISSPQTVGTPITGITLTAQDAANQTVTSFTGTVTFGGTGGFSGTSGTFILGVLSGVSVTPTLAGTNLTFTVDDGASHVGSATITTIQTQYEAWASGALFDADANGDGLDNGLAFLLGATSPTSAVTLPTVSQSSGNLILTFSMLNSASRGSAALNVQHSSDLGISDAWESALVPDADNTVNDVVFDITAGSPNGVVATIPVSKAASGKLFGRLKAQP